MLQEEITANRKRFISALETNAADYFQITGALVNRKLGGVCALGMGMDEFGIDISHPDVYSKLSEILGMKNGSRRYDPQDITYIYALNDNQRLTFKQIAARLRQLWDVK